MCGKANETTPYEQAISEAQSTYNKKIDEQYCYVQPKLNGARCLIKKLNHAMRATSRGGKEYRAIEAIKESLMDAMDTFDILDGELYNHELSFQEIMTAIKNETDLDINLSRIQYWVWKDYFLTNVIKLFPKWWLMLILILLFLYLLT